jgi:RNA polymerase sigma factor (sigma-70 family)
MEAAEPSGATAPAGVARREVAALFDAHADALFRYIARRVGPSVAEDVVSDAFAIALDRYDLFQPERGTDRGWLFGIANNLLRHHWRSEERRLRAAARHEHHGNVSADPLVAVDGQIDAEAEVSRLIERVEELDPDDRDLLVMYAWEQLPYADIAGALGVPVGTVRSRLSRLRTKLREQRSNELRDQLSKEWKT